jgi:RimJ/RimL family protein N-acetyltransferase
MMVVSTARLELRRMTPADAAFIVELVNEPAFIQYIGDKAVRNEAGALRYIADVALNSYQAFGFGLYAVTLKADGTPIGVCGLLKRAYLDDVDIGFAFLAQHRGQGFALEAAAAVLAYGRAQLGLPRIVATTAPANFASMALLAKLGFRDEGLIELPAYDTASRLFSINFPQHP